MRPTKLSAEVLRTLVAAFEAGASKEDAAARAGIARRTLADWLEAGDRGVEPYAELALEVRRIEAQLAREHLHTVRRAARGERPRGNWRSAAWLLARRFPKLYGDSENE